MKKKLKSRLLAKYEEKYIDHDYDRVISKGIITVKHYCGGSNIGLITKNENNRFRFTYLDSLIDPSISKQFKSTVSQDYLKAAVNSIII